MRLTLFLLLISGLLAGAAIPFAPEYFSYGLAALALLLGGGGLVLLQWAVFAPIKTLTRDLRALDADSALPGGDEYGALQNVADQVREHAALLRRELVKTRESMEEAVQNQEDWREKYKLAITSQQMTRENLDAITLKARRLSTELASQFRKLAHGAGAVSPGVEARRFQAGTVENDAAGHGKCIDAIMRNMSEAATASQQAGGRNPAGREEGLHAAAVQTSQFLENFNAGLVLISEHMMQLEDIVDDLDSDLTRTSDGSAKDEEKFARWGDALAIGVTAIDEQHKLLVSYVNELHRAVQQGREESVVLDILDALADYATSHFSTEEVFFMNSDYPEAERHIKIHEQFKAQVTQFRKDVAAGSAMVGMEVLEFLKNWLIEHIQGTDRKIGPYVRKALEEQD